MGDETHIAWADATMNPWIGCTKVSVGPLGACENCYAEAWDIRFKGEHWGPGAPRRRTSASNWAKPWSWNRKAAETGYRPRVMCGSLCDVLDNEIPDKWRADLWALIRETLGLRWMLITKRIGNAPAMLADAHFPLRLDGTYAHVGVIASTVTQDEIERDAPKLFRVPAAWWGFSVEPQMGPIALPRAVIDHARDFPGRVWIISGGESYQRQFHATRADVRGYNLKWAFSLKAQCALAGIAYFKKQLGAQPYLPGGPTPLSGKVAYVCDRDPNAGADPDDWPAPLRVQEFPDPLE
jgi:protein gp37